MEFVSAAPAARTQFQRGPSDGFCQQRPSDTSIAERSRSHFHSRSSKPIEKIPSSCPRPDRRLLPARRGNSEQSTFGSSTVANWGRWVAPWPVVALDSPRTLGCGPFRGGGSSAPGSPDGLPACLVLGFGASQSAPDEKGQHTERDEQDNRGGHRRGQPCMETGAFACRGGWCLCLCVCIGCAGGSGKLKGLYPAPTVMSSTNVPGYGPVRFPLRGK